MQLLNPKSFSRLCQISSTLQALKRNRETLLFGFPFSESDRKWKGTQTNLRQRTKCGAVAGGRGSRRQPSAPRPRSPGRGHLPRTPQRTPNSGGRAQTGRRERLRPGLAPLHQGAALRGEGPPEARCSPPPPVSCAARGSRRTTVKGKAFAAGAAGAAGRSPPGPDAAAPRAPPSLARRSPERSGRRAAFNGFCIPLPSDRGGRGRERKRSERQTGGDGVGGRRAARPRPALSVRPAPPPPPRTAPPLYPRRSPAVRPRLCPRPPHPTPQNRRAAPLGCAPREEGGERSAGRGRLHPPSRPRGGARPADSFRTRAGPSGETGAGGNGRSVREDSPGR